ncbi:hypothetical protein BaRGS_00010209 [Batillaria attramentaria]|uniref:Uncharacterized protein n=1 Tax=Batillaria attramentaria TaxID=370345 RepID=A0ABD0LHS0_9CAEN
MFIQPLPSVGSQKRGSVLCGIMNKEQTQDGEIGVTLNERFSLLFALRSGHTRKASEQQQEISAEKTVRLRNRSVAEDLQTFSYMNVIHCYSDCDMT